MSLECLGLHVGSVIFFCMKTLINYAKMDDVMEDEENGGREWIVRGNPAMQIDSIVDNRIGSMLFF